MIESKLPNSCEVFKTFNTYKYYHNGNRYYGQGVREEEVRLGISNRMNIDFNLLKKGRIVNYGELRLIVNKTYISHCKKSLGFPNYRKDFKKLSIKELMKICNKSFIEVVDILRKYINLPTDMIMSPDDKMSTVLLNSNNKLLVRLHKVITSSNGEVLGVISRIDDFKRLIKLLLNFDYNVILETNRSLERLREANSKYVKANKLYESMKHTEFSNEYLNSAQEAKSDFDNALAQINYESEKNYNTGYFISTRDIYDSDTYSEYLDEFDSTYEKLRDRIIKSNIYNAPYNKYATLLDIIDSYQVSKRQNNNYAKLS